MHTCFAESHSCNERFTGSLAITSSHQKLTTRYSCSTFQRFFTAHSWSFTDGVPLKKQLIYRHLERAVQPLTTKIITVSEHDRKLELTKGVAPTHKMVTIHNGIEQIVKNNQIEQHRQEGPLILVVARFEVPKRQDFLLAALAELTDIPWQLQFIGDGSLCPSLEKYVVVHNLTERVQFLGNRMDVTTLLAKSQLFVLLSDWEGLPISIIEAMRAGLPVIASNVGSVNELIVDGEHGFLIERNEKVLLKKRLQQLLSDETLRKK